MHACVLLEIPLKCVHVCVCVCVCVCAHLVHFIDLINCPDHAQLDTSFRKNTIPFKRANIMTKSIKLHALEIKVFPIIGRRYSTYSSTRETKITKGGKRRERERERVKK